jgi:adenosylcobinamide-GDP ribazoletransferase
VISGLRLSLGLLSILPVGQVRTDRSTAGAAMLWAPVVGLILGAAAWVVGTVVHALGGSGLLASVAVVATLAVLTRGLHLDGLADLADGLGSARPAAGALAVMRRSDIGPFGVLTLVLVLLAQVAALAPAWSGAAAGGAGGPGGAGLLLLAATTTGRLSVVWACRAGVPAARSDGLGALVAGTVPTPTTIGLTAATLLGAAGAGALVGGVPAGFSLAGTAVGGLVAALLLLRTAVARLGGVTGDVMGALIEAGTTAVLVLGALIPA